MRWLTFGTYNVHSHPRVGVLIEGLRASGDEVVEVNEPLRLSTAGRVAMLRQPWRLPVLVGKLLRCWALLVLRARRARRSGPSDAVLVGYLGHFDVRLARLLFRRTPIVLDHLVSAAGTARDRGLAGSSGLKARLMRWIDDGALRRADLVVVDTQEHLAELPGYAAGKAVVAPVGATQEWFALGSQPRPAGQGEPLRVIFVGLYTPLHGTRTIGAALAALAGDQQIAVTMVGTGQEYAACRAAAAGNTTIQWLDWVPAGELPALVAAHDVSLGIFGTTAKARNVVPTKVYQGAAAGLAVVTSDTAPQRAALGDAAVLVPPGDPEALAAALHRLAKDREELRRYQRAAHDRAVQSYRPASVVAGIRARVQTG
ncbi:MAG: glycosyltransferase [Micromonosporaceae bacterium]|nr:glycosyltransferase [Micromonosporaceae bacterium]